MAFHRKHSLRVPFVLIALLTLLLSACVAPAPGSGGQAAATEKPKLTVWAATTFTPDADTTQDDQIKAWGEANGVEIDLARMSQDERTPRWQTAIESKQFPDCAAIEQADLPKFIQEGVLVETTEVMQKLNELEGGFTDGAFLAGRTADGKHWSVPSFSSTEVFYVRKDKLEEKGLALPETWEDVLTIAQAINDPDNQFWGWGKQMGTPSWDSEVSFTAMLWAFGGKTWDEEGKPAINSPETRQLLDFIKSAWDAGVIPPDGPTWDDGGNNRAYQSEIVGMTLNTGSILRYLQTEDQALLDKTAVIPVPAGPAGRFISGYYYQWGVFNTSAHPELCLDLLAHLFAPDQLRPFYEAGGGNMLPVYKEMLNDEMWQDPVRKVLADMVPNTRPQGYPGLTTPWILDAWMDHTMAKMLNRVLVDGWSNDDAIAEAEAALQKWYDQWQQ
ncbi:MAG: extracellular solute-binding protein [Caldilinea sp. CFX5]|nr:extracellular solute-binding protein [Caldilinea sp. CFX5]